MLATTCPGCGRRLVFTTTMVDRPDGTVAVQLTLCELERRRHRRCLDLPERG